MKQNPGKTLKKRRVTKITKDHHVLPPEYVAAENNLETIGYFDASYKRRYPKPKEAKEITLGQDRTIRILPNATYGYPNTEDLDLYRGFLRVCDEQVKYVERWKSGKRSIHPHFNLPIQFSTGKLLRYTGRDENADDWRAVREWMKRQTLTGIEGSIYIAKQGKTAEMGFTGTLFQMVYHYGDCMENGRTAETNCVWPSGWFLSNYYYHYLKPVDLAFHRRLRKAIAKGLYPLLDQGWYATEGGPFAKSYEDLTTLLAIPTYRYLSRVKQQLDPSHHELKRERFLEAWEYRKASKGHDWVITYHPGAKFSEDQKARVSRRQLAEQIANQSRQLPPPSQLDLLDDDPQHLPSQEENLLVEILAVCGDTKNQAAYRKAIREYSEGLLWMALSETKQAALESRIKKSKGAYFMDTLKRLAKLRRGE